MAADDREPPLRADARRNRERIIEAARVLFIEAGFNPAMDEIARRAGVGVGTLYRRFPDRETLVVAVADDTLQRIAQIAQTALAEQPDGWRALRLFLWRCVDLRLGALQTMLDPALHQTVRDADELVDTRRHIVGAITEMVERAHKEGALRPDATVADIAALMTLQVHAQPMSANADMTSRAIEIALDGLRARPGLTALTTDPESKWQ